jgi:dimethylaniline monooxygenase (N-oxide forming)
VDVSRSLEFRLSTDEAAVVEQVYPGFWTQTNAANSGFSDVEFKLPPEAPVLHYDFYEAKYITEYFEKDVDSHACSGQTLRDRIRFHRDVTEVRKEEDGSWAISTKHDGEIETYYAGTIIVASGHFGKPIVPALPGRDAFAGPVIHTQYFGRSKILEDDSINSVVVLGGSKSSADLAYQAAKAGKQVSWIIRKFGSGPPLLESVGMPWPICNPVNAVHVRLLGRLAPSVFKPALWWDRLLHSTERGSQYVLNFWNSLREGTVKYANYDGRPGARPGFKHVKPDFK